MSRTGVLLGIAVCIAVAALASACSTARPEPARPAAAPAATSARPEPRFVPMASREAAVAVSVGSSQVCAALRSGRVACWGDRIDESGNTTPLLATGLTGVVAVEAEGECVRRASGPILCFSNLEQGWMPLPGTEGALHVASTLGAGVHVVLASGRIARLGTDGRALGVVPKVEGATSVTEEVWQRACAVLRDGRVACFGDVEQIGLTPNNGVAFLPGIRDAVAVAHHAQGKTCAFLRSGAARCFGPDALPTAPSDVVQVSWRCLRTGGNALCLEGNEFRRIDLGGRAVDLSCYAFTCCAAIDDGSVRCFGENEKGLFGDGAPLFSAQPTRVAGVVDVARLALGNSFSMALTVDGRVLAWGRVGERGLPQPVRLPPGKVVDIVSGEGTAVARFDDGALVGLMVRDEQWRWERLPDVGAKVRDIAMYEHGVCALLEDGSVRCLFDGHDGTFTPVEGFADMAALSPVGRSLCGVSRRGSVRCFVDLRFEDNEDEPTGPIPRARVVEGLSSVRRLARTYAELSGGVVASFSLEENDRWTVTTRPELRGIERMSIGRYWWSPECGLRSDRVVCWGAYEHGVLGRSWVPHVGLPFPRAPPAPVDGDFPATAVVATSRHACAIHRDGSVFCWGSDEDGALARGRIIRSIAPVRAAGLGPAP